MNKENDWDYVIAASMVEGPIKNVTRKEMAIAIKVMKPGKAAGPSEVCAEMISASGEVGVSVMVELFQRVLDEKSMPDKWQTSVLVPIFKGKGDVRNCSTYKGVKLLEHTMKIVERVLERRIRELVNIDPMQFGFVPGRGTTDALLLCEKYNKNIGIRRKIVHVFCGY